MSPLNPNPNSSALEPSSPSSHPYSPHNLRIYTLILLSSLGSWMFGYNNAYISGILILPSFHESFKLPPLNTPAYDTTLANIVSLFQIGGLLGSVAMFAGMKFLGRKGCLAGAGGVFTIGAVGMTLSNGSLGLIYAGRFITGLGTGSITVVVPLYIAELSPPSIRGSLIGIYEINNQLASLLGYWVNYIVNEYIPPTSPTQWRLVLSLQIIPSVLLLLSALFILPETPRFLLSRGKPLEARRILAYVRKLPEDHDVVELEMREIEEAIVSQAAGRGYGEREDGRGGVKGACRRFLALCRELGWKGNRNRVAIGVGLMAGQNLTGINGVNFYTPYVFRSIGFGGTKVQLMASGMFALVKSLSTILSLAFLIDRLGRRKLLLASSIGTALSLWYIGSFVEVADIDLSRPDAKGKSVGGWIAIVCVYVYAAAFSIAWNGVVWVYCAEIFPTRIKDLAICITTAVQWLGQFAVARATPSMVSNMRGGFFLFFAACITIMFALVYFLVPETKGRTLEGMDDVFGNAYAAVGNEVEMSRVVGVGVGVGVGMGEREGKKDDEEVRGVGVGAVVKTVGLGV